MKLDELIKTKYGSVDKMIESTKTLISRSYLYQLISGDRSNLSVAMAQELVTLLDLESIEKLMEILNANKEV